MPGNSSVEIRKRRLEVYNNSDIETDDDDSSTVHISQIKRAEIIKIATRHAKINFSKGRNKMGTKVVNNIKKSCANDAEFVLYCNTYRLVLNKLISFDSVKHAENSGKSNGMKAASENKRRNSKKGINMIILERAAQDHGEHAQVYMDAYVRSYNEYMIIHNMANNSHSTTMPLQIPAAADTSFQQSNAPLTEQSSEEQSQTKKGELRIDESNYILVPQQLLVHLFNSRGSAAEKREAMCKEPDKNRLRFSV